MITRKYTYLVGEKEFKKVEIPIYNDKSIGIIYAKNKGYALYNTTTDILENLFLIATNLTPTDFKNNSKSEKDKEQFIELVSMNLNQIYNDAKELKEYMKKHPEYIFIQLMDLLEENKCTNITEKDELYNTLLDAFLKLDIDTLKSGK